MILCLLLFIEAV